MRGVKGAVDRKQDETVAGFVAQCAGLRSERIPELMRQQMKSLESARLPAEARIQAARLLAIYALEAERRLKAGELSLRIFEGVLSPNSR